jgi:hypothetical protein
MQAYCTRNNHSPICLLHAYGFDSFGNSVFTPYYSETVLYSSSELRVENEDGISILFYLQKIFPGISFFCCSTL